MKKLLIIPILVLSLTGCNMALSPEEIIQKSINPFKEHKINDQKLADMVEKGILQKEAETNGLDLNQSSAHLISYTKIGTYGKGEVRILGYLTDEGLEKIKKNPLYKKANGIVTYTATFEYSEKTGAYTWRSDYPYN